MTTTNLHTRIFLFYLSLLIPILTSLMVMEPSHLTISQSQKSSPLETIAHDHRVLGSQRLFSQPNNRQSPSHSTEYSSTTTTTDFVTTTATSTSTTANFRSHVPLQTKIHNKSRDHSHNDKINPSSNNNSPIFENLNKPATISLLFSVGTILVIVASVGALGIRRSARRLLPAENCTDLVDRLIELEKSPTWITWTSRDIVQVPGVSTYDASLAKALNVTINDIQNLRKQANIRKSKLRDTTDHHQISDDDPPPNLRHLGTLSSIQQHSMTGRRAGRMHIRSPPVNVVLARSAPAPPEFSVNEVIQLRRRFSCNSDYVHDDQRPHHQSHMPTCHNQPYPPPRDLFSSDPARPKSTNMVKIGQSLGIIVTAYSGHPLRLKRNRNSLCAFDGNIQLHGRLRSNSLPSEMVRYFAYMALSRHMANITQAMIPRSVSALSDATILSIDETCCHPTYDSEGNVIVVPAYQLVAHNPIDKYNREACWPGSDDVTEESVHVKKTPAAMRLSYHQPEHVPRNSQTCNDRPQFFFHHSNKTDTIISIENQQQNTFHHHQVIGRSNVQHVPSSLRRRRSLLVNSVSFLPTLNNRSIPDPTQANLVTASHVYTPARSAYLLNDHGQTRTSSSTCISIDTQVSIIEESIIDIDTDDFHHNDMSI